MICYAVYTKSGDVMTMMMMMMMMTAVFFCFGCSRNQNFGHYDCSG
jgi:hypothetical protein